MADSLVEILNTTLDVTELPNSTTEHTLLTTDANTSYLIKDVQISTGISDLNLTATINGFALGSWAETLTGSEIMDVSSNIKVKSKSFPVEVLHLGYGLFNSTSGLQKGGELGISSNKLGKNNLETFNLTGNSFSGGSNVRNGFVSSGNNIYQIYIQNNNIQYIYGWLNGASAVTNSYSVKSYAPIVYVASEDAIYFCDVGSNLVKITLSTGGTSVVKASAFLSTSTYVRTAYSNGWMWYIRHSSYTTQVNALRLSDGLQIEFSNLAGISYSSGTKLAVSYDADSDKFYVYRSNSQTDGTIVQSICPLTKTAMDAFTSDQVYSSSWTEATSAGAQTAYSLQGNYFGATMAGHPTDGDKFYGAQTTSTNASYDIVLCSFSDSSFTKIITGEANSGPILDIFVPTAAQIAAFGYDGSPSAIDIRVTGVKSTTA